jgi:hypothetical protein
MNPDELTSGEADNAQSLYELTSGKAHRAPKPSELTSERPENAQNPDELMSGEEGSAQNLYELTSGKAGSALNLAYRIRNGLCPIMTVSEICLGSEEERQWAIEQITRAADDYDASFFRTLADGLKQLKANNPSEKKDPNFFLLRSYGFLKREMKKKRLPFRQEVIDLAERQWAIVRVTGHIPHLPLPDYDPNLERKIEIEISDHLPSQKWSRACKTFGLKFSPAKRGRPKKKAQN